jgi:hypothetical protein
MWVRLWTAIGLFLTAVFSACGPDPLPTPGSTGLSSCPAGNRTPHIDPIDPVEIFEGERFTISVVVSDPDGDDIFVEAEGLPDGAIFEAIQGVFVWQPPFDLVSPEQVSVAMPPVTLSVDDICLVDTTDLNITVFHINRPPFFLSSDAAPLAAIEETVAPGTEQRVRFQVIDPDDDEITLQLDDSPAYARVEGSDTLVLAPVEGDSGVVDDFSIVALDGSDETLLPVRVVVGDLEADLPAVTDLVQGDADGPIELGESAFAGRFTFSCSPHSFEHDDLRLQVDIAPVGIAYEEGETAISDAVTLGVRPSVDIVLDGGESYRWQARYLSDEFGAGPFVPFGDNVESEADFLVVIVPETVLDVVPNNPSPIDVIFEFYSTNVPDFECQVDDEEFAPCNRRVECDGRVDCRDEGDCTCARSVELGLSAGRHTFRVRGVTRDGTPDPTPAEHSWDVLNVAEPNTTITRSPPATVTGCTVEFSFTGTPDPVTFECRLDKEGLGGFEGDFIPCSAPKEYVGLTSGDYRFHVRAVNLVSVVDLSPATYAFTVTCTD